MKKRGTKKKSNKKSVLLILSLVLFGFVTVIFVYVGSGTEKQAEEKLIPVKVSELSKDTKEGANFLLSGTIKPKRSSELFLDASKGKVLETLVKEGDNVTKGQELFRYVSPENEFEVNQAQLEVDNQAKILQQKQEESAFKWNRHTERQNELNAATQKYNQASEEEKESLKQDKDAKAEQVQQSLEEARLAETEVKNAALQVEKAQINVNSIKEKFGDSTIRSEIDGRILKIDQDQLNTPSPSKDAFMQIIDDSALYVEGMVDEFRKDQLKLDQPVKIVDRSGSDQVWTGKVTKIDQLASSEDADKKEEENPNLSKYPYRALLDSSDTKPALDKNVYLSAEPLENEEALFIPLDYLVKENGKYYVWVVKNSKISKTEVAAEEVASQRYARISSGLSADQEILLPQESLKEGMMISGHD